MKAPINPVTLRWADQQAQNVVVGQASVRSPELVRVHPPLMCPMPLTWRVIAGAQANAAGNFVLPLRLVIFIGIGSFATEARFDVAFNATFMFEFPAQTLSIRFEVNDVVVAADRFVFGAGVAPNIPWKGLEVSSG